MFNPDDLNPQSIDDCVFGNATAKVTLQDIVSNTLPFPAFGKCAILLYGTWGTGKTTLARLLPDLMEQARKGQSAYSTFHKCAMGANGMSLINKIEQQAQFNSINESCLHYFVLDEVDNLTANAQQTLKAVMNYKHVVFIMTTNHIEKIDRGVINRSYLIQMDAAAPADWLPVVKRTITKCGAPLPPDSALLPIIQSADGSARDIISSAVRVAIASMRQAA